MPDWSDIYVLVFANGVIDTLLGLAIGIFVVARIAARRAKEEWTAWLMSKDSEPYMDKLAARVIKQLPAPPVIPPFPKIPTTDDFMEKIEPRIQGLEERISQPLDLDLGPIVKEVTENVIKEVDKVRAVIDGKLGWEKKIEKQTGEAIAEQIIEAKMEGAGINPRGGQGVLYKRFKALLQDGKWTKEHPAAAAGIDAIVAEMETGEGSSGAFSLQGSGGHRKGLTRLRRG